MSPNESALDVGSLFIETRSVGVGDCSERAVRPLADIAADLA
jgi:hypothetical protein